MKSTTPIRPPLAGVRYRLSPTRGVLRSFPRIRATILLWPILAMPPSSTSRLVVCNPVRLSHPNLLLRLSARSLSTLWPSPSSSVQVVNLARGLLVRSAVPLGHLVVQRLLLMLVRNPLASPSTLPRKNSSLLGSLSARRQGFLSSRSRHLPHPWRAPCPLRLRHRLRPSLRAPRKVARRGNAGQATTSRFQTTRRRRVRTP